MNKKPTDRHFFSNYEVTEDGRVWSKTRGKFLQPILSKQGYETVRLFYHGYQKPFSVHRLVALAWVPNLQHKPHINHKDGNKRNNHANNLEWCTPKENSKHAWSTGLRTSILVQIAQYTHAGEFLRVFPSPTAASQAVGLHVGTVYDALSGRIPTAGGFQWSYLKNGKPPRRLAPVKSSNKVLPVRNVCTGKTFFTCKELTDAGYSVGAVVNAVTGRTKSHAGCRWERASTA